MRVNMMLERRMDQLTAKLDKMLADLTPSSAKVGDWRAPDWVLTLPDRFTRARVWWPSGRTKRLEPS